MARRGFGGMTALRAALGAAVGVGEGLQQRELLAEKRRREAEEDMFRRIQAGLMPVDDILPQEQGRVGPLAAAPSAAAPAAGMQSPTSFGQYLAQRTQAPAGVQGVAAPSAFGAGAAAAPERSLSNVERVMQEFQGRTPRTVRIGEQRYAMQPTAQENSLLNIALQQAAAQDAKTAEASTKSAYIKRKAKLIQSTFRDSNGKPLSEDAAMLAAEEGKTPIELGLIEKKMTEAERQSSAARWSELQLSRDKFNFEKTKPATEGLQGSVDYTAELQTIQDFLPTVGPDGKVVPPKRTLSGPKSLAVQQGGQGGTFIGQAANLGLSSLGADMTNEQLYNSIAEGIATSYAMQEQKGKNVSDKDIANRISQIKVLPNEVGSLEVQRLKGQRLLQWANSLKQGNVPQVAPGQTATPPRIAAPKSAMTPDQWMDANPQKAGETDAQYEARYRASMRGGQ